MKKFWIGLLVGALAVPGIFFGTTAIVAHNNDRTLKEQIQVMVEADTIEGAEEETEDEDVELGIGSGEDQGVPVDPNV